MTIDIVEGDLLVIGAAEYPIQRVRVSDDFATSPSFKRIAVVSATTKRASSSGGKRLQASATNLNFKVTRFSHVSVELANTLELETPHKLKRCYCADEDGYLMLVVEDQKR